MIAAIGDIHGELTKLDKLLLQVEDRLDQTDTILFIGDYIDRGPDSKGVIDRVLELGARRPVVALRGNHEQMLLDAYAYFRPTPGAPVKDPEVALCWFSNGADKTLESYGKAPNWWQRISAEHWAFIRETKMECTAGSYLFVHAGILPKGQVWREPEYDSRLWIREQFLQSAEDFGRIVVFGHTPLKGGKPLFMRNKIGIDTAAAYGGPLTAILLDPDAAYDPESILVLQAG